MKQVGNINCQIKGKKNVLQEFKELWKSNKKSVLKQTRVYRKQYKKKFLEFKKIKNGEHREV